MKALKRIALGLLILIVILAGAVLYIFKIYLPHQVAPRSFPQTDGDLPMDGLLAPVDIYRDAMGVPTIYAENIHDLFFAQGYVHAQERFWQMDTWRHIGSGRLSEMFGKSQLETDKFLRTMGWEAVAQQEYETLSPASQALLDAYAEGVNAYLKGRAPDEVSLEYWTLHLLNAEYQIEPWRPVDSLVWGKAMAWDLRGNMDEEIARALLLKTLSPEQVDLLYPPYPQDGPTIITQPWAQSSRLAQETASLSAAAEIPSAAWQDVLSRFQAVDALVGEAGDGVGSNSWALSGDLTASGQPILANDPHLGIQMPSIWYQMNLHCRPISETCAFSVGGFSFAGVPGIVIGHNERIAWGFTNVDPDVMDLYIEKINPDNPMQYEYNGQWVDFATRQETIQVAGGEPVTITVRISRHGPIISDTYGKLKDDVDLEKDPDAQPFREKAGIDLPQHYAIALSWTALQPSTPFESIWGLNLAQDWDSFRAAALQFDVPAQNLTYADVDGNIGYQMPGLIPIRRSGDGRLPVPGWTDAYDWNGYLSPEDLPYAFNPPEGFIVTANNRVPPQDYPFLITDDWAYPFRAARIVDMIRSAPGPIDASYIQSMHFDARNGSAAVLVPLLLAQPLDDDLASVRDTFFAKWDYQMRADSQSALLYAAFWQNLLLDTFADDLPESMPPTGGGRWMQVMDNLASDPNNAFWDDRETAAVETRDDIFQRAWQETVTQMRSDYGRNPEKWPTWGEEHTALFANQTLGKSGVGLIEALFNRGPFPASGDKAVVNATGWKVGKGFGITWLPSMRMIIDFSNLDDSLTVHTTGQSGHAFSPHYIDMAPMWATDAYYPMWWSETAVTEHAVHHLILQP